MRARFFAVGGGKLVGGPRCGVGPLGGGFSLLELLVAVAVLAILGVLVLQTTTLIARSTRASNAFADATDEARVVYDRIGMDLGAAVLRGDVRFLASATNAPGVGNMLTFLAAMAAPDPPVGSAPGFRNRRLAVVAYRTGSDPDRAARPALLRGTRAIGWTDRGFMGLDGANRPAPLPTPAFPGDFDMLSGGVVAAVVGFQLEPDGLSAQLADGTSTTASGQVVYSPPLAASSGPGDPVVDPARIAALVVGLATADPARLGALDASQSQALRAAFGNVPSPGELPVEQWMADTANLENLPATVPAPVRQSVQVFQRFFPINPSSLP